MRVVFISSWAADNGLSRSTVQPHLAHLTTYTSIEKILYISMETGPAEPYREPSGKVEHVPIVLAGHFGGLASRALDQVKTRYAVTQLCAKLQPDLLICRGTPAGALGYMINRKTTTPYYVESFEPHAEYMAETGTWSRYGIKYLVQKFWERQIKKTASGLITVSTAYARHLVNIERISPNRIRSVPCWVDGEMFRFNSKGREIIRQRLSVGDSLVCVYLGQFGGMYYGSEAFRAMCVLSQSFGQPIHFLLLTPTDLEQVRLALGELGLDESEYSLLFVDHAAIPDYLSAADFAISFHRSIPMAFSYSPIKYGEYWSCGLPLIAPENVGDDATWIDEDGLGCTADFTDEDSIRLAARKIAARLDDPQHREHIRKKGLSRRSKRPLIAVYDEIIGASQSHRSPDL